MALRWDFEKDYYGFMEVKAREDSKPFKVRLYDGNALMIACSEEDENKTYTVWCFFLDEAHAKNCLGLSKGYENILDYEISLTLNNSKNAKKIAQLFAKAKFSKDLTIKILNVKEISK